MFPPKHPYLPKDCGNCSNGIGANNLGYNPNKRECKICSAIRKNFYNECISKQQYEQNKADYEKLKNDPNYRDVFFDINNGGLMAYHIFHNFDGKGGKYEKEAQLAGFKNGHAVIFGPERHTTVGKKTEGLWDGMLFEVAGRETATENNVLKGLKHCASKLKTEVAILVYPNGGFDLKILFDAIKRYRGLEKIKDYPYVKFKKIICIQHEEIIMEMDF